MAELRIVVQGDAVRELMTLPGMDRLANEYVGPAYFPGTETPGAAPFEYSSETLLEEYPRAAQIAATIAVHNYISQTAPGWLAKLEQDDGEFQDPVYTVKAVNLIQDKGNLRIERFFGALEYTAPGIADRPSRPMEINPDGAGMLIIFKTEDNQYWASMRYASRAGVPDPRMLSIAGGTARLPEEFKPDELTEEQRTEKLAWLNYQRTVGAPSTEAPYKLTKDGPFHEVAGSKTGRNTFFTAFFHAPPNIAEIRDLVPVEEAYRQAQDQETKLALSFARDAILQQGFTASGVEVGGATISPAAPEAAARPGSTAQTIPASPSPRPGQPT